MIGKAGKRTDVPEPGLKARRNMRLLNDVQDKQRLAYLLGLNVEQHRGKVSRRAVRLTVVIGAVALLLFLLWNVRHP